MSSLHQAALIFSSNYERFMHVLNTSSNLQTSVAISVYEGERPLIKNNRLLGKFAVNGLPALPAGEAKVDLEFALDTSGILNVTATDKSNTRNSAKTKIIGVNQNTSSNSGERIFLKDAREFKEQDDKEVKRMKAYVNLHDLVQSVQNALSKCEGHVYYPQLTKDANDMQNWLKGQEDKTTATFETFKSKRVELEINAETHLKGRWFPLNVRYAYPSVIY